eukprot:9893137-Heterocapsa_arctica.AAC.1
MPLFPSEAGSFVAKDAMVDTIREAARAIGLPTLALDGSELFGGHTLRVTGARWLAAQGMPLLTIQLLARWASAIIMRYVAEAPLEAVTSEYRRAQASVSLQAISDLPPEEIERVTRGLDLDDSIVLQLREEIALIRADWGRTQEEVDELRSSAKRARDAPEFILNPASGKYHRPLVTNYLATPPVSWRSRCGWPFGLSAHSPSHDVPANEQECRKCFPQVLDGSESE